MSLKILWNSTVPWGPSSYSVLTKRTIPGLVRMGHEFCVNTWYGLQGEPQKWAIRPKGKPQAEPVGIVTILPGVGHNDYGAETLTASAQAFGADVVISCMDVWVLPVEITRRVSFAPWIPVDHDPCPQAIVDALSTSIYTMVMSQWGTDVVKAAGLDATFVPCSADAHVFKPGDKKLARKKLGIPDDAFLVSFVAANKDQHDRKGFSEGLQGFARFAEKHDDARLYLHTLWKGSLDIPEMCTRLDLQSQVIQPNQYALAMGMFNDNDMRDIYNASDVLLNPAKSEGFGLPMLEAQMCGTPVIASDFSTTEELLFAGWKVSGQKHWSMGANSWRLMVNIESVVACLEEAYTDRGNELLQQQARNGALAFDTDNVLKRYWKPAMQELEEITGTTAGKLKLVDFG